MKCLRTYFDMDTFSCFGLWNWCPQNFPRLSVTPCIFDYSYNLKFVQCNGTNTIHVWLQKASQTSGNSPQRYISSAQCIWRRAFMAPYSACNPPPPYSPLRTEPRHSKLNFSGYVARRNGRERDKSEWKCYQHINASQMASFMATLF